MIIQLWFPPFDEPMKFDIPNPSKGLPPPVVIWRGPQGSKWRTFYRHVLSSDYYEVQPVTLTAKMRVK